MDSDPDHNINLPPSSSPSLILTHPTTSEIHKISLLTSTEWAGVRTTEEYIDINHQIASLLSSTHWILTIRESPADERPILVTCETLRKRCFVKYAGAAVTEVDVEGIGGVFCDPKFRRRGYGTRLMKELANVLRKGNASDDGTSSVGSILYSDIGRTYYAQLGWMPLPSMHVELPATSGVSTTITRPMLPEDVAEFCTEDRLSVLESMGRSSSSKTLLAGVPGHLMMVWYHMREDFTCQKLFGRKPSIKGAVAGEAGNRVWAIWTLRFGGPLDEPHSGNKLYILRLVIDDSKGEDSGKLSESLKAVLQAAQRTAAEWGLSCVEMWNPSVRTKELIEQTGLSHRIVERVIEEIPSLMWFGGGSGDDLEWLADEKHAWI